ncbi:MAG: Lrp/AsnC family transcriptional regulator [Bacillota bacterium]
MDAIDKKILVEIADDLVATKDIFGEIGAKLGIPEEEVLKRLRRMQSDGILKRIAPVISHYNTGYAVNAMVVWIIGDEEKYEVGKMIKNNENISHIYERETRENWPYNLYTMIHGKSPEEIESIVDELSARMDNKTYKVLYTKRQWKKTSPDMKYYLSPKLEACRDPNLPS